MTASISGFYTQNEILFWNTLYEGNTTWRAT